ncbi:MAG: glycine zipper family protein [Vampirovibrionales bacterium]
MSRYASWIPSHLSPLVVASGLASLLLFPLGGIGVSADTSGVDSLLDLKPASGSVNYTSPSYTSTTTPSSSSGWQQTSIPNQPSTGVTSSQVNAWQPSTTYPSNYTTPAESNSTLYQGRIVTLPKGYQMLVRLDRALSSASARLGEPVNAVLESDVVMNGEVILPRGSELMGTVTGVNAAEVMRRPGELDIRFNSIRHATTGATSPMQARVSTTSMGGVLNGNNYRGEIIRGAATMATTTGVGALAGIGIGHLAGSVGRGAAFGASAGLIGGSAMVLLKKGREVVLPESTRLNLSLEENAGISLR